jgi:hypothetical protein
MQFAQLKRRDFIALIGGAAAWATAGHAQQGEQSRRAFLNSGRKAILQRVLALYDRDLKA